VTPPIFLAEQPLLTKDIKIIATCALHLMKEHALDFKRESLKKLQECGRDLTPELSRAAKRLRLE
jgi:hypothetical protein